LTAVRSDPIIESLRVNDESTRRVMKQITLRGIPDDVTKAVKEEARQKGLSLNKAFLSALQAGFPGVGRRGKKNIATWTIFSESGQKTKRTASTRLLISSERWMSRYGKEPGDPGHLRIQRLPEG
jgi:hypothetical protein